jgi:hypothetical protein
VISLKINLLVPWQGIYGDQEFNTFEEFTTVKKYDSSLLDLCAFFKKLNFFKFSYIFHSIVASTINVIQRFTTQTDINQTYIRLLLR